MAIRPHAAELHDAVGRAILQPGGQQDARLARFASGLDVQIECWPGGLGPFLLEGDRPGQRTEVRDAEAAVSAVLEWLELSEES